MVYRIYVEKKPGLCHEADALKSELVSIMGINALQNVRIYNRYDVENIEKDLFDYTTSTVFSEPQLDIVTDIYTDDADVVFAVEFLPGQFDQRANSASECIQIISKGERPIVKTAKVYALYGKLTDEDIAKIKGYVINPVEAREASLEVAETLKAEYEIPTTVKTLDGFCDLTKDGLADFMKEQGLAMDLDDITFCQEYLYSEHRDHTFTEI